MLEKYLDQDPVNWTDLIPDDKWENPNRSRMQKSSKKTKAIGNSRDR